MTTEIGLDSRGKIVARHGVGARQQVTVFLEETYADARNDGRSANLRVSEVVKEVAGRQEPPVTPEGLIEAVRTGRRVRG